MLRILGLLVACLAVLVGPQRTAHAQSERVEAAWQGVVFDIAGFLEVVALVEQHHVLPKVPPRAWAMAVAGAAKTLQPPVEVLPADLYKRMISNEVTAPLVAGERVLLPACAAAGVVAFRKGGDEGPAPTNVEELRARRQLHRDLARQLRDAWDEVGLPRDTARCLLQGFAAQLAAAPTPAQDGDAPVDSGWRTAALTRLWRQAAHHFLSGMDAHGGLIPTALFTAYEREAAVQQAVDVGLVALRDGNQVRVQRVERGGPAAEAGIQKGDILVQIDGRPVATWGGWQLMQALEGKPGSTVEVAVQTGKAPKRTVKLVRRAIAKSTVASYAGGEQTGVAVLRVPGFASGVAAAVTPGLEDVAADQKAKPRAVVLDLRGNGGGWVKEAIAFADRFLSSGVVASEHFRDGAPEVFEATASPDDLRAPLVVLVDNECRSACELVAAALQDQDRAVVVGQRTYGKGSVQAVVDAKTGPWSVLVTIAIYRGPRGRTLQAQGVEPDLPVAARSVAAQAVAREADSASALRPVEPLPPHKSTLMSAELQACVAKRQQGTEAWRVAMRQTDPVLLAGIEAAICMAEAAPK
ncbi:MAG: PDZ domain-containing protein [Deltaproteobacteria bacterium]|nr:PDZ domain-containing protein [Deltaproteobacteria bacterium]